MGRVAWQLFVDLREPSNYGKAFSHIYQTQLQYKEYMGGALGEQFTRYKATLPIHVRFMLYNVSC